MFTNKSIQSRLVACFVSLVLCSIVIVAVFSYFFTKRVHLKNISLTFEHLAQEKANKMDIFLESVARIPPVLVSAIESDLSKDEPKLKELIRKTLVANPDIYGSAVVFKPYSFYPEQRSFTPYWWYNKGVLDYIQHVPEEYLYWESDWYVVPRDTGKRFWSEPYYDEGAGESLMVTHAAPFYDEANEFLGVATVDISLSHLNKILNQVAKAKEFGQDAHAMLFNNKGKILGIDDPNLLDLPLKDLLDRDLSGLLQGRLAPVFDATNDSDSGVLLMDDPFNYGNSVYLTYASLENTGWTVIIFVNKNFMLKNISNLRISLALFVVLLFFISIFLVKLVARSITKPLKQLTEQVSSFSGGEFDLNVTAGSIEISKLINAFSKMNERISDNIQGLENEILERTKTEKKLELFKSAVDASSDAVGMSSPDGKHWYQNNSFDLMFGKIGDNPPSTVYVDEAVGKEVFSDIMKGKSWVGQVKMYGADKEILDILLRAYAVFDSNNDIVGLVGVHTDITELKRSQAIMIQTEKMMSVGGLAAGMAHEINNPLSAMLQTVSVLSNRMFIDSNNVKNIEAAKKAGITTSAIKEFMQERGILRMLETIRLSGNRIANIVENMLSFSRKSDGALRPTDIVVLIDRTVDLATNDYNIKKHYDFKEIEIIKEYDEDLPYLVCEEGKIQQVILNILKNGAQVMHETKVENPHFIIRLQSNKEQKTFHIEIEDNGPGMTEHVRKRVFEPFYSTKPAGDGTGLGLSVSYFIITENHHGTINVESQLGQGSKFIINLPNPY